MKTQFVKFKRISVLSALLLLCVLGFILTAKVNTPYSRAESFNSQRILPVTDMEYTALLNPKDVCYTGDYCAVIQGNKLSVFKDNKLYAEKTIADTLKQVKAFEKDKLIISKSTGLFYVDISTTALEETRVTYFDGDQDTVAKDLGGNYFDIVTPNNSTYTYIISAFSDKAFLLKMNVNKRIQLLSMFENIDADYPVVFNPNGMIYFCSSTSLYQSTIEDYKTISKILDIKPSKMVANNDKLYYVYNSNEIYTLDISSNSSYIPEKMTCTNGSDKFELGKIIAPTGISLKDGNLFLTDASVNAVQEFYVDGDKLTFSGFAIANGKTAYNRIGTFTVDSVSNKNVTAVVDENKLTVIMREKDFDAYDKSNYLNFFADDLDGTLPKMLALSENSLLFSDKTSKVWRLDLNGDHTVTALNLPNDVYGVLYASGVYYACTYNGTHATVYSIDRNTFTATELTKVKLGEPSAFTVDVNKNVYLADKTAGKIVCLLKSEQYANVCDVCSESNVKSIYTDLSDTLFILSNDGNLSYLDGTVKALSFHSAPIKSLFLSFESKEIVFITDGQTEGDNLLYATSLLPNVAIDNVDVPQDYGTTGANADIQKFKVYTVKDGANMYSVTKGENGKFIYQGLCDKYQEYVYICTIDITELNKTTTLLALASKDGTVLIKYSDENDVTPTISDTVSKAYITTSVNFYFLPLITKDGEYSLSNGQAVRLVKGTPIFPQKIFSFDNKTYYFAEATVSGTEYFGYVPTAFTAEVLSQNYPVSKYDLEQVYDTDVYSDTGLSSLLTSLSKDTTVRVLEKQDNYAKIAFKYNDEWTIGYIKTSAIIQPKLTLAKTIIAVVAIIVATVSTAYLILKKKNS